MSRVIPSAFLLLLLCFPGALLAQEQSVRPGVNDPFNNLSDESLSKFVERFEREGREIFDLRKDIIDACKLRPAMSVADIGAGTGLFTQLMAPKVAELYAVDINQKFLDHITEKCNKDGLKNVKTVLCEQTSCGLEAGSVDAVLICDTYHHFEFPYKSMRSIRNALKPNGIVVLVEFDRIEGESSEWILNHVRADRATFSKEIELAGFEEIEMIDDIFKTSYLKRYKATDRKTEKGHTVDSLQDVQSGLKNGTAVLIDVREQAEWDAGHLQDATLVPLSELKHLADDKSKLAEKLPKDKIVYTHCKKGGRAAIAAQVLEEKGFDIRPLSFGFETLLKEGFQRASNEKE